MKHVLLVILYLCTALTLPTFAQDTESPNNPALTTPSILRPWKGDLDGMVQRRVIRALVAPSRTSYWLNGARQTGAEYDLLKALQEEINDQYQTQGKHIRIHVVFIPTSRDQLIPGLLEGRGDIAAGLLTVTPERLERVDFGDPFFRGVKEIAVTGPISPALASVDDLSGKEVFVRKSSSFWTHLEHLNERFGAVGVMQLMPATGNEMNTGDITQLEPNIHAGIKYIRLLQDQFCGNEPMDARNKILFSFAAYNAGPGRVQKLRKEAKKRGLDPNVWFNNVEIIAAQRIGEETVTYVANVHKYYIAYKLVEEQRAERERTQREPRLDIPKQ